MYIVPCTSYIVHRTLVRCLARRTPRVWSCSRVNRLMQLSWFSRKIGKLLIRWSHVVNRARSIRRVPGYWSSESWIVDQLLSRFLVAHSWRVVYRCFKLCLSPSTLERVPHRDAPRFRGFQKLTTLPWPNNWPRDNHAAVRERGIGRHSMHLHSSCLQGRSEGARCEAA